MRPYELTFFCGNSDIDIWLCMRVKRRIRSYRICTALLRNLIPKCRNLRIGRRCRGRWLSSNRNSSRNVVHRVGGKTQSAEPWLGRGRISPAGGDDRPVLGWSWCSPPLRWTTKRPGSLPIPTKLSILGVGSLTLRSTKPATNVIFQLNRDVLETEGSRSPSTARCRCRSPPRGRNLFRGRRKTARAGRGRHSS